MKQKIKNSWLSLVILNVIITVAMVVIAANKNGEIVGKLLIVAGPPILFSIIVWAVLQYAMNHDDYTLIAGYNEKNRYNKKELKKVISYIQGYVITISFLSNFVLFMLSFFPEYVEMYPYVLYFYLANFFVGIIVINRKNKHTLYLE